MPSPHPQKASSDVPDGFGPPPQANIEAPTTSKTSLLPLLSSPAVLLPLVGTVFGAVCQVNPHPASVNSVTICISGLHRDLPGGVPRSLWPQRHPDRGLLFGFDNHFLHLREAILRRFKDFL